jgi:hypothetical protein
MKGYIEKMKQQKMDLITLFKFRKSGQISHQSKKKYEHFEIKLLYCTSIFGSSYSKDD